MVNLMRVKERCILLWPLEFPGETGRRGGAGHVVDMDSPAEREFCAGQEWKLEPAPAGAKADPITHPMAVRRAAEIANKAKQAPREEASPAANAQADDDLEVKPGAARAARPKAGAA